MGRETPDTVKRIKEMIVESPRISQSEIAIKLGVAPRTVSHLCRRHQIQSASPSALDVTRVGDPCPECGNIGNRVKDSRPSQHLGVPAVMRRRKCAACGHRWTTYEMSEVDLAEKLNPETVRKSVANSILDAALEELRQ